MFLGLAKYISFFSGETTFLEGERKRGGGIRDCCYFMENEGFPFEAGKKLSKTFRGGPMLHLKIISMVYLQPTLLEITPNPKLWVRDRGIHLPPSALASSFDGKGDLLTFCRS